MLYIRVVFFNGDRITEEFQSDFASPVVMVKKKNVRLSIRLLSDSYTIKKKHTHYTSFITPDGLFEFNVMPLGLVNAPSIFQKLMNTVGKKMKPETIVCNVDDDVISAKTAAD